MGLHEVSHAVFPEMPGLTVDDTVARLPETVLLAAEVEIEEYVFPNSVRISAIGHRQHDLLITVREIEAECYALKIVIGLVGKTDIPESGNHRQCRDDQRHECYCIGE